MPGGNVVEAADALRDRIERRQAIIGVLGLGDGGLPLARAFSSGGCRVVGFDTDPIKVDQLQRGESYISHVPANDVQGMRRAGFSASDDFDRLPAADALLICVPT